MTYDALRESLQKQPHDALVDRIIDDVYNGFIVEYCDFTKEDEKSAAVNDYPTPQWAKFGKRVPYLGWFWRRVNFSKKEIYIGFDGEMVGFMENNKWDHKERKLTPIEVDQVIALLDKARAPMSGPHTMKEKHDHVYASLTELDAFLQSLKDTFPVRPWDME